MSDKNTPFIKARIIGLSLMAVLFVFFNALSTQYLAHRFGYHLSLGKPIYGQVYNPFDWWKWTWRYYEYTPDLYTHALVIFAVGVFATMISGALIIGIKSRSSRKHQGTHGTARFATPEDVEETGLLDSKGGVYCGGWDEDGKTRYLRHNGPEHICAIAPTRSGKGVGLILPTLLAWPESAFVLDPKGENYALTSGWRKEKAGNIVLRFDPARPDVSCKWNPLEEIRIGTPYQIKDAQNIALLIIDSDGEGLKDHWKKSGFKMLPGVILHAIYKRNAVGRFPCLLDIAGMLTGVGDFAAPNEGNDLDDMDRKPLADLWEEMRDVRLDDDETSQLLINGVGQGMLNTPDRELGSIISTVNVELALYWGKDTKITTSRSDFTITDLMQADKPVSLYFTTNPDDEKRLRPISRMLLTQIVMRLTGPMEYKDGRAVTAHKHRLLLMLDEFPTLGKLEVFQGALAYIAGYGIKAYIIMQDIQQLYAAYTNHESIMSNCHVQIAYAPNKLETAEWLSKMTGVTTVIKEHVSTSGKRFAFGPVGQVSMSYQEAQRPLMTADEIRRLPKAKKDGNENIVEAGEMLIFVAGHPVIRGRQILYFIDPVFSERAMIAPPKKSDVVREEEQ